MSFLDLASLATYRQHELEARVYNFVDKCDRIINDISKLKLEAQGFIDQLICDPSELKDRFLNCMRKLEEYSYLITDFSLAVDKLDTSSTENSLVQHTNTRTQTPTSQSQAMAVLSSSSSSQSKSYERNCSATKISQTKNFKSDQVLIMFSNPSIASKNKVECNGSSPNDGKQNEENSKTECSAANTISNNILTPTPAAHLMDVLSESQASPSNACQHHTPSTKIYKNKLMKSDQLIAFSSNSGSLESVPENQNTNCETEVQCKQVNKPEQANKPKQANKVNGITVEYVQANKPEQDNQSEQVSKSEQANKLKQANKLDGITVNGTNEINELSIPPQAVLQTDVEYEAFIMHVDGTSFWIITDNVDEFISLGKKMNDFYKKNSKRLTPGEIEALTFCAVYDDDTERYYRGLRASEEQVFLVDTGEIRSVPMDCIQPLMPMFCTPPAYARCCHLSGVDIPNYHNKELEGKLDDFLKSYIGTHCTVLVDDNSSDSLGVYMLLPGNMTLNDILVKEGFATYVDFEYPTGPGIANGDLDIAGNQEYDDPVEAVTGYHNRDEADICKHYKGGPEKTCFKGARCKKRHVLKHPGGWTLDRVEVTQPCQPAALPAPGKWLRVHVTAVGHFNGFYVQPKNDAVIEEVPQFGVVMPPMTLQALNRDMNSPAVRQSYKPLKIAPAPGEMVASLYPLDGQWYRARVLSTMRADQSVEVIYIDYGNTMWVKEDGIRVLDNRFTLLPAQAIRCRLAGVSARSYDSRQWATAKRALQSLAEDRLLDAHVISRGYDEITVELYDEQGRNIAEQLASMNVVQLQEYAIEDDSNVNKQKNVIP